MAQPAPNSVYDPEAENDKQRLSAAELARRDQEAMQSGLNPGAQAEADRLNALYRDSPSKSGRSEIPGIRRTEESAGGGTPNTMKGKKAASASDLLSNEGSGGLYNPAGDKPQGGMRGLLGRAKSAAKKHKKKLWLAAGGVGGLFVLLMLLLFLAGSLLIPHFFQNMLGYRFAGAARNFRQANEQILSREIADQAASDSRLQQIKDKYHSVKSFLLLEKYRPAAIVRNLKATGALDFVYEPRSSAISNLVRGPRMTAIKINGETIPLTAKSRFGIPFSAAGDNIRLAGAIDQALATSWKGPQGPIAILRTATGAKILEDIGWHGFYAWANKAKDYKTLDAKEADRKLLVDDHTRVSGAPAEESLVKKVQDGANQTEDAVRQCYQNSSCLDEILRENGGEPASVLKTIDQAVNTSALETATGTFSTTYAIAVPACFMLDGSIERAGPQIDARSAAVEREFMYFGAAAHQQESGDTAAAAVGAFNRKFNGGGDAARSNIQQLAQGGGPNTQDNTLSPQATALGDLTVLDAIFRTKDNPLNGPLTGMCQVLTDWRFAVAEGTVELGLGFFTGGGSEAAEKAGAATAKAAVFAYLKDFGKTLASKATLKKLIVQGGTTSVATLLARLLVNSYAGQLQGTGQAMGSEGINETDAGGTLMASEENRTMGGAPMTAADTAATHAADRTDNAQQQQQLGFTQRYFALSNSQSLFSRMGDLLVLNANHSSIASALSSAASHLFNPFAALGLAGKFSPSVSAAGVNDTSNYGTVVWDFTEAEKNFIADNSSFYDIYENDYQLQQSGKEQAIQDKYGKCYDESQGTLLAEGDVKKDTQGNVLADQGLCSPNNLGLNNNEFGPHMVFRWRVSKRIQGVGTTANEFGDPSLDE